MKNKVVAGVNLTLRHRAFIGALAFIFLSVASAQTLTVSLEPVMYGDYNVSCFGKKDGAINATVTGGVPPYSYLWSRGDIVEDIELAASGYYKLTVTDATNFQSAADITLIEPEALKVTADLFKYPSGLHISCYECFNGSVTLDVYGGVAPFTYQWSDDVNTPNRSGLGAMTYDVKVTDANGCTNDLAVKLDQPEKATWGMEGNVNTNAAEHFIGTSDAQDVVFKSNGTEMLRLKSNGDFSLMGSFTGEGPLYRMEDGTIRGGGSFPEYPELPPERCRFLSSFPYWETRGNAFNDLCPEEDPLLGTLTNLPLKVVTNGELRMYVSQNGPVGIGTIPPANSTYRLFVEGGIATRDVLVKLGDWPDYVFAEGYNLMPLTELKTFLATEGHLPGIPTAREIDAQGGFEVGDMQKRMMETIEQQTLYILQLEERLKKLEEAFTLQEGKR